MRPTSALTCAVLGAVFFGCGTSALRAPGDGPEAGAVDEPGGGGLSEGFLRLPDPFAGRGTSHCGTAAADAALALLNGLRATTTAPALLCLVPLGGVAAAHAGYLAANDAVSLGDRHRETSGKPGFTGESLGARADAAGLDHAAFWLSEGVGGNGPPAAVLGAHLATVYHRSPLLTPGARYFSYADVSGAHQQVVMDSLAWLDVGGLRPVVWPADGASAVPRRFGAAREVPDPVPDLAAPGYPVSVHFPRYIARDEPPSEPVVEVLEFALEEATGALVETRLVAPAADPGLARADAFLVPAAPLAPGRDYVAHARLRYGALAFDRRWRFHTEAGEGT